MCRYGIPKALVSDNGKQFDNLKFKNNSAEFGIKNYYSSPTHPVRPEKFQILEKWKNRNFGYKIVILVKNPKFIL